MVDRQGKRASKWLIDKGKKPECYLLHGNKTKETNAKTYLMTSRLRTLCRQTWDGGGGVAKQTML